MITVWKLGCKNFKHVLGARMLTNQEILFSCVIFERLFRKKLNICEPWKLNATSFQNIKLAPKIMIKKWKRREPERKEEENGNTIVIITESQ
jgi:hypothetical protein